MNEAVDATDADLVAFFDMEEGSGATLSDPTGHSATQAVSTLSLQSWVTTHVIVQLQSSPSVIPGPVTAGSRGGERSSPLVPNNRRIGVADQVFS